MTATIGENHGISAAIHPPRKLRSSRSSLSMSVTSVAILTGAAGTFCAGADLKAVATDRGNRVNEEGEGPLGCTRMLLSKPVNAAVEGFAVASGIELALWCDFRVAARNAIFGVYCQRFGVPLCDDGTIGLRRFIGMSRTMDMILTGRGVSGEEAFAMGEVVNLDSAVPMQSVWHPPR